jgi:hypothetical protein
VAFAPHALVAISGAWTCTDMANEVWQFGIRVYTGNPSGNILANPQTYCDAITPNIRTWFTNVSNRLDQRATLKMVKVNNIGPDGKYLDQVTHQTAVNGPTGGGTGQGPVFNTVAVTLETGTTTGRARRGRVYPPFANSVITGQGVSLDSTVRDSYGTAIKSLLTILLINEPTGGLLVRPCIASRIDAEIKDINGVSVDSVIDVQRRRKNRAGHVRSAVMAFP